MKEFSQHRMDLDACRKEVRALRRLLQNFSHLDERAQILPFFRRRPHLAALCGLYNSNISRFDLLAWEYDLFGEFSCDLAVGDSVRKTYSFIEFEDAGPKSLFIRRGKKATREWSPRFDQGYGQIIDWFYKLHDRTNSDEFQARFGARSIDFNGTLVIGRDRYLNDGERLRLRWRREHVIVHSKRIQCVTFDELLDDLFQRLDAYSVVARAAPWGGR
jgi:Domain of unknown function (DUF4263)